ncbi:oleate delta-12 desaturase [Saccharata proteae CBS 121410]|uniref:Oleate delta-12 desaturase n=1 Tax=Saccharata proteae CBS 121410 TaxID=1314787 RepID=A0A9P4I1F9_9PEZI|nr:oleate delta-12 desaturase [Saccharata proteae CBS 121410]
MVAEEKQQAPNLADLKRAIPSHCFEPTVAKSMGYLVRDILCTLVLGYAALHIHHFSSVHVRFALWALYSFAQGCIFTGLWIIAHECGHGAFSKHARLNDAVGWLVHSFLLVPYYSWKISHARHHRFTGHVEKDLVFSPQTATGLAAKLRVAVEQLDELAEDTPFVSAIKLLFHQLLGWQTYLLLNVSAGKESQLRGQPNTYLQRASHFDPWSAIFLPSQAHLIIISDVGLALTGTALYLAATRLLHSWSTVFLLYGLPYFWVHHWLIAITYLHHTHPSVPHYADTNWSFTKGNLCTVDRDFGFIGRVFFHDIIDTHVVHHLFPKIPFYHAHEATRAIVPLLGDNYHEDKSASFVGSLWTTFRHCNWVEETEKGVFHWAKKAGAMKRD